MATVVKPLAFGLALARSFPFLALAFLDMLTSMGAGPSLPIAYDVTAPTGFAPHSVKILSRVHELDTLSQATKRSLTSW